MKKVFFGLLILGLILPIVSYAVVDRNFGGRVMTTKPCDEGLLITLRTPLGTDVPYMWIWGNLPYLSRIAPYPSQNVLGIAKSAAVPCTISGVPYAGGVPIIFHGSSF